MTRLRKIRTKNSISRLKWLQLAVLFFAFDVLAATGTVFISRQDRLELTNFYSNMLRQKLISELKLIGVDGQEPAVSLSLEFDETRVSADAEAWKKNQDSIAGKERDNQSELVRRNIAELVEKYKPVVQPAAPQAPVPAPEQKKEEEPEVKKEDDVKGGVRLGRLNVDIANSTISEIISKAQEEKIKPQVQQVVPAAAPIPAPVPVSTPVTLAISVPPPSTVQGEAFVFKAADYIKKISVEVTLPATTPKAFSDSLPGMISTFLDFQAISKGTSTANWVKVRTAPPVAEAPKVEPPKPTPQTFLESIWRPDNAFISTILSVLILGLFVFLAMFVASRALSKGLQNAISGLGKDIAALKPAEESKDSEEDVSKDVVAVAGGSEGEQRGSFDAAAAGQALTRDMQNIRVQMTSFIAENTFLSAEYLSDMFYDDNGLADFRDILSFMGYAPLKPALDHLPRSAVEKLEAYIEEHRETPPTMLNGAEIAQRMYGECVSKATLRDASMKAFDPVRAVLIKYEDAVITKFISEADTVSVAVLLKTLTVERGNRLMRAIPGNVLKAAAGMLDKPIDSPDQVIAQMITKLTQVSAGITERSQAQRRLILRLVKTVSVTDEGMVYDLIPAEDWDLKRQIMHMKLFLKDAVFVPTKTLAQAFGSLPLARRAEVMILAEQELKSALTATVGSGNKRAEMLQTEVDQTQKNAKKIAEINSRKEAVMESFISAVRRVVSADKTVIDQIILAQSQTLGIKPPEGISTVPETRKTAA